MASRVLVSGLPRSLPPLPPGPAPTCVPCVEGRQRAAPHSSEFPPTEAPLQTLHMDVWPLLVAPRSASCGVTGTGTTRSPSDTTLRSSAVGGCPSLRALGPVPAPDPGCAAAGATGVGAAGGVGAGGSADAGPSEGAGAGTAGAGGTTGAGAPAGSPGAVPAGSGGASRPRPYFVPLLEQVLGLPPSPSPAPPLECPQPVQSQSLLQPVSPLSAPSPYTGPTGGLAERRAPASRPASFSEYIPI
ncbi:unnamed protein product [Closterium sp. NIES-53]